MNRQGEKHCDTGEKKSSHGCLRLRSDRFDCRTANLN
jgi:hypothetical protein